METHSWLFIPLVLLVALVMFSAFFSSSETAFSSLNRIKLKTLAAKSKRARLALNLLEVYDKLLSTVLIGNNIVNIAASSLATALFIRLFGAKGLSAAMLVMTLLILIFAEITPKTLAKENPELAALRAAPLLKFFLLIFSPLNFLSVKWKKFIMRIFHVKTDRGTTEDELLTFVEEVRQEGGINYQEEKMIRYAIDFDDLKVSGIFTPRIDVEAVSDDCSIEEIDSKFIKTGFSRLPVYKDSIDNILGIIILKDFYHEVMKGLKTPAQVLKPVVYVTKTIKIAKLLRTLQQKKAHMAVVVDEHGGTLGIVTIEDIMEELVGEIWDEHDDVVEPVRKNSDGSFRVLGSVNFCDMLENVTGNIAVRNNDEVPDTTVANWIMEKIGRLPHVGEKFNWPEESSQGHYLTISVLKVIRQRVMEVRVKVNGAVTGGDTASILSV